MLYIFFLISLCASETLSLSLSVSSEVAVSSLLCLSSVRELPVQVCELYQKGFVLAAVHPFVHSCGPASANLQKQLHRAVLIRETHRYTLGMIEYILIIAHKQCSVHISKHFN